MSELVRHTLVVFLTCAVPAHAQLAVARYRSSTDASRVYLYAYDFDSGSALRIEPPGDVLLIVTPEDVYEGLAGASYLKQSALRNERSSLRIASQIFPQLIVNGIQSDSNARLLDTIGPLGGPTYEGDYPLGNRLMQLNELPTSASDQIRTASFDFDERGCLRRVTHQDTGRQIEFNLAEDSSPEFAYLNSFADGAWVLDHIQVNPWNREEFFEPEIVVRLARGIAFESAAKRLDSQITKAATQEGLSEMRRIAAKTRNTGSSQAHTRLALIITGILVIAGGCFAWWKNRA